MPNHVHLVAVPLEVPDLCRAMREAHRRYPRHINFKEGLLELSIVSPEYLEYPEYQTLNFIP